MDVLFHQNAWEDYRYFQKHDQKILDKINKLIKDIEKKPFTGIGKPEALKYSLSGFWSRRINQEHRLVYSLKDGTIFVLQCRYHY
jgi:toxin YoeB